MIKRCHYTLYSIKIASFFLFINPELLFGSESLRQDSNEIDHFPFYYVTNMTSIVRIGPIKVRFKKQKEVKND